MNLSNSKDRKSLSTQIKADIDQWCADKYNDGHRNHLGASLMGETCSRKLWYNFRWIREELHEGRVQRLFQVGHEAEPRFKMYLEGIGFVVKLFDETKGKIIQGEVINDEQIFKCGDITVKQGDWISIDGSNGAVYLGEVPVVPSAVT